MHDSELAGLLLLFINFPAKSVNFAMVFIKFQNQMAIKVKLTTNKTCKLIILIFIQSFLDFRRYTFLEAVWGVSSHTRSLESDRYVYTKNLKSRPSAYNTDNFSWEVIKESIWYMKKKRRYYSIISVFIHSFGNFFGLILWCRFPTTIKINILVAWLIIDKHIYAVVTFKNFLPVIYLVYWR